MGMSEGLVQQARVRAWCVMAGTHVAPAPLGRVLSVEWLQQEAIACPYHVSCLLSILLHIERKNLDKRRPHNLKVERTPR